MNQPDPHATPDRAATDLPDDWLKRAMDAATASLHDLNYCPSCGARTQPYTEDEADA